jgi:hypothetical protein
LMTRRGRWGRWSFRHGDLPRRGYTRVVTVACQAVF